MQKQNGLQMPLVLKVAMYGSELFIVNALFFYFFHTELSPGAHRYSEVSSVFGWMSMAVSMAYVCGVSLRPMSFFYRTSRRGNIVSNVTVSMSCMILVFIAFLVVVGRTQMFMGIHMHHFKSLHIPRIVPYFVLLWGVFCAWRFVCRGILRLLRGYGRNLHHVVLVGASDNILELFEEMRNPITGYHVLGYFNDVPLENAPEGLEYLGRVSDVIPFLETQPMVHQLYCALPSALAVDIRAIVNACERTCVRFFSVPNVRNYLKRTMQLELLGSVPVLIIREDPLSSLTNRILKRTFDIVVSGLFMIPFWLIIYPVVALISHLTMPGPVFFKQKRNGLNGEEFVCLKFRSMKVNADADRLQATEDDPRKTKWGNIMRKTSIDELPQFINVLKGDMSIVGPRPHMVKHTEEYSALIDKYMVRHWVRPGITGWAQVTGARGETKELWQMEDRIKKDIWYVENWNLWLDIKIMFLTVYNALGGDKQAY